MYQAKQIQSPETEIFTKQIPNVNVFEFSFRKMKVGKVQIRLFISIKVNSIREVLKTPF